MTVKDYIDSKYNIVISSKNKGKKLLFNSLSNALVEINDNEFPFLCAYSPSDNVVSEFACNHEEWSQDLIKGNFVIDRNFDEVQLLKYLYNSSRFRSTALSFTILPTMLCNFTCDYCYQKHDSVQGMSTEVQTAVSSFIENHLQKSTTSLHIEWYGGEPLLEYKLIDNMSRQIMALAKEKDIPYSSGIVTNGYLIDDETIDMFSRNQINAVQITLDGTPELHDRKRKLKNGKGTFWRIIESVKKLSDVMKVSVRINIDKSNANSIPGLIDLLIENKLNNGNVYPYLGYIKPYTSICKSITHGCLGEEDFAETNANFVDLLHKKGFPTFVYPRPGFRICGAVTEGVFAIDPEGYIFKCWEAVSLKNEAIGNVLRDNMTTVEQMNYIKWMNYDPFDNDKCRDCNVFPICLGGCPSCHIQHGETSELEYIPKCDSYRYDYFFNKIMHIALEKQERNELKKRDDRVVRDKDDKQNTSEKSS